MISYIFSIRSLVTFVFVIIVCSCQQESSTTASSDTLKSTDLKESMARVNQRLIGLENEKIRAYIQRYNWNMQQTGTGLYYMIYKKSTGIIPGKGDIIEARYTSKLLNGQELYDSSVKGPLIFELGKSKTINGLEEGIFLMRLGERAKFIIPSHLAFGLLGDQEKIPQRATLVYDVELISVKKRQ